MNNFIALDNIIFMKKLLFPTDLADHSRKALDYAQYLSISAGLELVLFHASMDQAEKANAQAALNRLVEELKQSEISGAKTIPYDTVCTDGLPVVQVVESMEKSSYKMLLMPTAGGHRDHFQGIYLKSNTSSVMEKIHKPVLFFPLQTTVDKVSKVLIAVDVMKYSREVILECLSFLKRFNAKIEFIYSCSSTSVQVTEAIERFHYFLRQEVSDAHLEVVMDQSFDEAIGQVIARDGIDLLVMTKYKQQFWEKWFVKSSTQHMAYASAIPVFVLSAD
jgi:nucleotide-binding universal stress UspA family protein